MIFNKASIKLNQQTRSLTIGEEFTKRIMLQHSQSIRHYQKITDNMVDLWRRGYKFDEIRLHMDGYISCLRQTQALEPYHIHRLEQESMSFLRDPSNFELPTMVQRETDYY